MQRWQPVKRGLNNTACRKRVKLEVITRQKKFDTEAESLKCKGYKKAKQEISLGYRRLVLKHWEISGHKRLEQDRLAQTKGSTKTTYTSEEGQ